MRLSPLDIKKQEFSRTIRRGFDPEEVQAFLDMLAGQWEDLLAEQRRTEEKVRELKAKMDHYERIEEALQEALRTARESSKHTLENAKQEAVLIVKRAVAEGEDLAREAVRRRDALLQESDDLLGRRDEIIARLRAFLQAETEMLERFDERNKEAITPSQQVANLTPEEPVAADLSSHEALMEEEAAEGMLDTEEREDVLETVRQEEASPEETPAEEPSPDIQVEVIGEKKPAEETQPLALISVDSKASTPSEEETANAFSQEDMPDHFSGDKEPLSFTFFESNAEDGTEGNELMQFAPLPEDMARKNGNLSRSKDRSPSDNTWVVRPVVASTKTSEAASSDASPSDEIDKIRRILSDLD